MTVIEAANYLNGFSGQADDTLDQILLMALGIQLIGFKHDNVTSLHITEQVVCLT